MADKREIAKDVLETALHVVTQDRRDQHGDAEDSFQMIADFWTVHITHQMRRVGIECPTFKLTGADVAHMMTQLKIARATYGNGQNKDHYIDAAGYQSLAAMLSIEPEEPLPQVSLRDIVPSVEPVRTPFLEAMSFYQGDAGDEHTAYDTEGADK